MNDLLFVSFDKDECRNETGICIGRKNKDESHSILKMALDKEADYLYALLTNQEEKAISISDIEQIKADIKNISETESITDGITSYGVQHRTGASVKNEILKLIDHHIKEYTE